MTALRITGGLLITAAGFLSGVYAGFIKKRQTDFMRQYIIFLTRAETMISYSNSSILYIIDNVDVPGNMREMLDSFRSSLSDDNSLYSAWEYAVEEARKKNLIDKSEIGLFKLFAEDFGTCGAMEEEGKLKLCISLAQERLDELNSETAEKTKLYRILGTFAGTLTAVLTI